MALRSASRGIKTSSSSHPFVDDEVNSALSDPEDDDVVVEPLLRAPPPSSGARHVHFGEEPEEVKSLRKSRTALRRAALTASQEGRKAMDRSLTKSSQRIRHALIASSGTWGRKSGHDALRASRMGGSDYDDDDVFTDEEGKLYDSDEYHYHYDSDDDEIDWENQFFGADAFVDMPAGELVLDADKNPYLVEYDDDKHFLPPVEEQEALRVLSEMQEAALKYVGEKAKKEADGSYKPLLERLEKMDYTESQLKRTLLYVRDEAPIICHVNLTKTLRYFIRDTHYRCQFETQTSGGCLSNDTRIGWEDRLFNKIYHRGCEAFERCKYGVLNMLADPKGVKCCSQYGDSYLLLKKVRLRTTFANKDSSASDVRMSTCEHYTHVLHAYNDGELKAVMDVANGKRLWADSSVISTYKEIQIHGPLALGDHVDMLVVATRHKSEPHVMAMIEEFSRLHNVPWEWMSTESEPEMITTTK